MTLADLDAIAVANTPGLAGSLLVGLVAAKALCVAAGKPLVAINHLHAHIYACRMAAGHEVFPCLGLIVSGGHTSLYRCAGPTDFDYLGGTIDDAAGEAFDKVAAMLGLGYPGGPAVSRAAERGNPKAFHFPRGLASDRERLDFSFSGLKTAVRYAIAGPGRPDFTQARLTDQQIADLAASFQEAVVDSLVGKTITALQKTGLARLCVGGGVAANRLLRQAPGRSVRRPSSRAAHRPARVMHRQRGDGSHCDRAPKSRQDGDAGVGCDAGISAREGAGLSQSSEVRVHEVRVQMSVRLATNTDL